MTLIDTSILIDYSNEKLMIGEHEFRNSYVNTIVQLEFLISEN